MLELIVQGLQNREIAEALFISEHTVKNHITKLFQKLKVSDRSQAIALSIQNRFSILIRIQRKGPQSFSVGPFFGFTRSILLFLSNYSEIRVLGHSNNKLERCIVHSRITPNYMSM